MWIARLETTMTLPTSSSTRTAFELRFLAAERVFCTAVLYAQEIFGGKGRLNPIFQPPPPDARGSSATHILCVDRFQELK